MLLSTLRQSRTHMHTVQTILYSHMKSHLLKSHNEDSWLVCNVREEKFVNGSNLQEHIRRHEHVKLYVCIECLKCFYTASKLKCCLLVHSYI